MSGNLYKKAIGGGCRNHSPSIGTFRSEVKRILDKKVHGLSFSPYVAGQGPGTPVTEVQIRQRLELIKPYTQWIRTFSCTEGNEFIPAIAAEFGLKTMVGIWLDDDLENNEKEILNAIKVVDSGHAHLLAVGNEVLLRREISENQLIQYIQRVKTATKNSAVRVGYVDAYFKFEDYPEVADVCDVIFANCYPFWEGYPAEHALVYMKDMYHRALKVARGKQVIISETGWPDQGTPEREAIPSYENAIRYFVEAYQWAEKENIDLFYFSSFDEDWKVADEGDVGAYWGLLNKDGKHKYAID